MIKKSFESIVVSLLLLFGSCTNYLETEYPEEVVEKVFVSTIDTTTNVKTSTALNVAKMFHPNSSQTRTSNDIKEIIPVKDAVGKVQMYIINYTQGYIIVSATRDYSPILAFDEEQNFPIDEWSQTGLSIWMAEQKDIIKSTAFFPDSCKSKYRRQWEQYSTSLVELSTPSTRAADDEQILALRSQNVSLWQGQGYTVYTLNEYMQSGNESENIMQEIYQKARVTANHRYLGGFENASFVLIKDEISNYDIKPLIKSTWGQGYIGSSYDYNMAYPSQYMGCVPVAMAQIMRYHQYPNYYNWQSMPLNYATMTTSQFLKTVGESVGIVYGSGDSGSNEKKARAAFVNSFKYSNSIQIISHNSKQVETELNTGRPVYMQGLNLYAQDKGHAWVCDGFKGADIRRHILLKVLEDSPEGYTPSRFDTSYEINYINYTERYFHMNWGYDGSYQNYFLDNNIYFKDGTVDKDYKINRKDIIQIMPN